MASWQLDFVAHAGRTENDWPRLAMRGRKMNVGGKTFGDKFKTQECRY